MKSTLPLKQIVEAQSIYPTPFYIYDQQQIIDNCHQFNKITSPFGVILHYAMKANSNMAILKTVIKQGFGIDASSLNEVIRAHQYGKVPLENIELTSQEVHTGQKLEVLQDFIKNGLNYTICSMQQLKSVLKFLSSNKKPVSLRIHPGNTGSGESITRNTANKYSCFGIQLNQEVKIVNDMLKENSLTVERIHIHIGSGSDPEKWKQHVMESLDILNKFFPTATILNLGGGYKIARMPHEKQVNLQELGSFMSSEVQKFFEKTGRKIKIQMEPGTFIVANAGYIVTRILDKKCTQLNEKEGGFRFLILDGGMDMNLRPGLYGSQHPFYLVSEQTKQVISDEFQILLKQKDEKLKQEMSKHKYIVVGKCSDSGDTQTISREKGEEIVTRMLEVDPEINDIFVIGGTGAYCSTMTPFNYNSHLQSAELLIKTDGQLQLIRKQQTLQQLMQNEIDVDV